MLLPEMISNIQFMANVRFTVIAFEPHIISIPRIMAFREREEVDRSDTQKRTGPFYVSLVTMFD